MKRFITISGIGLILIIAAAAIGNDDAFDQIKVQLAQSILVKFEIKHTVTSVIFGESDTTFGVVYLADDGRYRMNLNNDIYLFDGQCIWEYSFDNCQATKKCLGKSEKFENELFFLKDIGRYYQSQTIEKNIEYKLKIKDSISHGELPDSLILFIDKKYLRAIEYYDINDDLNFIDFLSTTVINTIDSNIFQIQLPDSTEIISLP